MSTLLSDEQLDPPANRHQAIAIAVKHCMLACGVLEEVGMEDGLAWQALSAVIDNLHAREAAMGSQEAQRKAKPIATPQPLVIPGSGGLRCLVVPKQSIRLVGVLENTYRDDKDVDRTYRIGDTAAYGGFNLTYVGGIVSIGPKTVTIEEEGSGRRKHRLCYRDFAFWNRYSTAQIADKNSEWYD